MHLRVLERNATFLTTCAIMITGHLCSFGGEEKQNPNNNKQKVLIIMSLLHRLCTYMLDAPIAPVHPTSYPSAEITGDHHHQRIASEMQHIGDGRSEADLRRYMQCNDLLGTW